MMEIYSDKMDRKKKKNEKVVIKPGWWVHRCPLYYSWYFSVFEMLSSFWKFYESAFLFGF